MRKLNIVHHQATLVDQVEQDLIHYFKENNFSIGSTIPNEIELAGALGVARGVLREALSRLKMVGMIEARTRRGMIITEPSLLGPMRRTINPYMMTDETMLDLLGFRISLELGIIDELFDHITPEDIAELTEIVRIGEVTENNEYATVSEYQFHAKLYQIVGNKTIQEFQEIIHSVMTFIKDKFHTYFSDVVVEIKKESRLITHADLLVCLEQGDKEGYRIALQKHFQVYRVFLKKRREQGITEDR